MTDQLGLADVDEDDESGSFESDSNASTRGNHHVMDQYSFLSDAGDADHSGIFEAKSTPNHQQTTIHHSFLPDASILSDTTIKMERSQAPTSESPSSLPGSNNVASSEHLTESSDHGEHVEHSKILPNLTKGAFSNNNIDGNRQSLLPQGRWKRACNPHRVFHGTRASPSPSRVVPAEGALVSTLSAAIRIVGLR